MADVFICYHETSAGELVEQIAAALESVDVSCWYAGRNLQNHSGSFARTIVKEIDACQIFLLILNKESNQSLFVETEAHLAFERMNQDRQKNIQSVLPVIFKVDKCSLSDSMRYYAGVFEIRVAPFPNPQRIQELVKHIYDSLPTVKGNLS